MKIFIDTEFTDLIPDNKLISIALVDETGEWFYSELTDTYCDADCSGFVHEHVLPLLKGGPYAMTSYECAIKMGNWINDRNTSCVLDSDNPAWDIRHIKLLLNDYWPKNLDKNLCIPIYIPSNVASAIIAEHNFILHNALDDAKIMQIGTQLLGL